MTKMPDKIYAAYTPKNIYEKLGDLDVGTEYTRSDLIPQPVTDEARAKALSNIQHIDDVDDVYKNGFDIQVFPSEFLETITSALSQPIKTQSNDLAAENLGIKSENQNTVKSSQPEAIQKALRGLELAHKLCARCTSDVCDDTTAIDVEIGLKALRTHQSELEAHTPMTNEEVVSETLWHRDNAGVAPIMLAVIGRRVWGNPIPQEWYSAAYNLQKEYRKTIETLKAELAEVKKCLKTTQTSLRRVSLHRDEVVKENADLRRAVVDLDGAVTGIAGLYLKTSSPSKRPAQILHESTISKAKAVQS